MYIEAFNCCIEGQTYPALIKIYRLQSGQVFGKKTFGRIQYTLDLKIDRNLSGHLEDSMGKKESYRSSR